MESADDPIISPSDRKVVVESSRYGSNSAWWDVRVLVSGRMTEIADWDVRSNDNGDANADDNWNCADARMKARGRRQAMARAFIFSERSAYQKYYEDRADETVETVPSSYWLLK